MKCPKCNLDIDENIMQCPMCQTELLEQLQEQDESEFKDGEPVETAVLMTAKDELQANIVESLLAAYGIPLRRLYKGNDSFGRVFMGLTVNGIELYVPKHKLEEAAGIVENEMPKEEDMPEELDVLQPQEDLEDEAELQQLERKYEEKRRARAWMAMIFFIPGIALLVGTVLYRIIRLFI